MRCWEIRENTSAIEALLNDMLLIRVRSGIAVGISLTRRNAKTSTGTENNARAGRDGNDTASSAADERSPYVSSARTWKVQKFNSAKRPPPMMPIDMISAGCGRERRIATEPPQQTVRPGTDAYALYAMRINLLAASIP